MAITLNIDNLAFRYNSAPTLENITFRLEPHEVAVLTGPNGTGKSTLLKCIDGLLKIRKGTVSLNGIPSQKIGRKGLARRIGYVPQNSSALFPFTVFDMVLLGRHPHRTPGRHDRHKVRSILRSLGIENLAMKNFNEISGGQQQKVTIARVLAQEAGILLLDEPTSNLDVFHQLEVMELLRETVDKTGTSAVLSMHDLNLTARYADKVILMHQGKIVAAGPPLSVLTPENIASVYRVEATVAEIEGKPFIAPLKPL